MLQAFVLHTPTESGALQLVVHDGHGRGATATGANVKLETAG